MKYMKSEQSQDVLWIPRNFRIATKDLCFFFLWKCKVKYRTPLVTLCYFVTLIHLLFLLEIMDCELNDPSTFP